MNENTLITIVKPYLLKCRKGDWQHAKRVVEWVKKLGRNRTDLHLIITAAYIHDIGWTNVLPSKKILLNTMLQYESIANANSKILIREVLKKANYKKIEIFTVIRLVNAADQHNSQSDDEAILVDADNLSKLCIEHVKEKYSSKSYHDVINLWRKEFPKRIKTKQGLDFFPQLLVELENKLFQ